MAKRKKEDEVQDIINKILAEPIPEKGKLLHPIQVKHRAPKTSIQKTLSDMVKKPGDFPPDITIWNTQNFVNYFARRFQEETGGNYRKTYAVDGAVFKNMGDFLVSNGLERNKWTKILIDWSFHHFDEIKLREEVFNPSSILRSVNFFYQDIVLPQVENNEVERDNSDASLLEEIKEADIEANGKITEVFLRFGIPVTISYLVFVKKFNLEQWIPALKERFKKLSMGEFEDKTNLKKIFQVSIVGSPYPEEFLLSNWREEFIEQTKICETESWWRRSDYKGKPLPKYHALLNKENANEN